MKTSKGDVTTKPYLLLLIDRHSFDKVRTGGLFSDIKEAITAGMKFFKDRNMSYDYSWQIIDTKTGKKEIDLGEYQMVWAEKHAYKDGRHGPTPSALVPLVAKHSKSV